MSNTVMRTIMKLRKSSCVDLSIFGDVQGQAEVGRQSKGKPSGTYLGVSLSSAFRSQALLRKKKIYVKNRCMKAGSSAELYILV